MKVTVGVSGGIAAYKAAEVVRALQRHALDVHVVMTDAAQEFITPLTFASLTGHKVITNLWPESPGEGNLPPSSTSAKLKPRKRSWLRLQPRTYWPSLPKAWPTTF
jgi:phosphopantothenoylcysteine synthetase/decarboxylase